MPEGPLLLLFKAELETLVGETIAAADTRMKTIRLEPLVGRTLSAISTWGKYLFLLFDDGALHLRIHWGMFGMYQLDQPRSAKEPAAVLTFDSSRILYLYAVSLRIGAGLPSPETYDPRADVMSPEWETGLALQKLRALPPDEMICDALLDQTIFAGLGNAIKTEALYAQGIHPETPIRKIPDAALRELVEEAIGQSALFLEGKKAYGHDRYGWVLVYRKKICPRCGGQVQSADTGALRRKSHWCPACQPAPQR